MNHIRIICILFLLVGCATKEEPMVLIHPSVNAETEIVYKEPTRAEWVEACTRFHQDDLFGDVRCRLEGDRLYK